MSVYFDRSCEKCLGTWNHSGNRISLYSSGKSTLWAVVQDRFGKTTTLSSDHIRGGINQNMSSVKLIKMMEHVTAKKFSVALYRDSDQKPTLNILLPFQAAGRDDEIAIEYAKKLIEQARGQRRQGKCIFPGVLDLYERALALFREMNRKKQIDVEKDIQILEKEIFGFRLEHSLGLYLPSEKDQNILKNELQLFPSEADGIYLSRVMAEDKEETKRSLVDHFTCAFAYEVSGGKVAASRNYLLLAEAYCQRENFACAFTCFEKAIILIKPAPEATADSFDKVDRKWLEVLYEKTRRPEITRWLLEKDAIRMAFETCLHSLQSHTSQTASPSCFVCVAFEEDVNRWLKDVFVPDLKKVGIDPRFCLEDFGPGKSLNDYQAFIRNAELVIVVCTPELKRKGIEREQSPFGVAAEIKLMQERSNDTVHCETVFPVYLKGNRKTSCPSPFLEPILGTTFTSTYYENAFELFGQMRKVPREVFRKIKEEFYEKVKTILAGSISQAQVEVWRGQKPNPLIDVDLATVQKNLLKTEPAKPSAPVAHIQPYTLLSSPLMSTPFNMTPIKEDFASKLRVNPQLAQALAYYVDLTATDHYRSGNPEDLQKKVQTFLAGPKPVMLIQGDAGSGKTTFMYLFSKMLLEAKGRIPLFIELKAIPERFLTKEGALGNFLEDFLKEQYQYLATEMAQLRQSETVIFLDSFDEMVGKPCNLFRANQLARWNCKVVITCRHEFLLRQDYHGWFVVNQEFSNECEECFIAPFSLSQIGVCLNNFCKGAQTWSLNQYEKILEENKELKELIENPLLLRMVAEVLPKLNLAEKASRYIIYEAFIKQWFDRENIRLKAAQTKLKGLPPYEAFSRFSERLAMQMYCQNRNEVEYRSPREPSLLDERFLGTGRGDTSGEKQWEEFFSENDEEIVRIRAGCPLRRRGNNYSFYNKSLLDFFVASYVYKTLHLDNLGSQVNERVVQQVDKLPVNSLYLSREPAVINFLAEKVRHQPGPIQRLIDIVFASRNRPELSCAASNAITILNAARVSFSGKDFSGIQVPHANLDQANLDHCHLAGANLQKATLRGAWLQHADLRGTNLEEVELGEAPSLYFGAEVKAVAYHPNGREMGVAAGKDVTIWELTTNRCLQILKGHGDLVRGLDFSPNGQWLATGGDDRSIRLWNSNSGSPVKKLDGHKSSVRCLAYSPSGLCLATGSDDRSIRLWDPNAGSLIKELDGHESSVRCLAYSPNGLCLATGSDDRSIRLWDPVLGSQVKQLDGHKSNVNCLAFSPNGKWLASGSNDRSIRLWDPNTGSSVKKLDGHRSNVNSLAFSPNGKWLASGCFDRSVHVWNLHAGSLAKSIDGHRLSVNCLAYSPDGRWLASGSDDRRIGVLDPNVDEIVKQLDGHGAGVRCLAYSPDGRWLASGSWDQSVKFWEPSTGSLVKQLDSHGSSFLSLAFSQDGRQLVSGNDNQSISFWEPSTGSLVKQLDGHKDKVLCLAFSTDGRWLASGSEDRIVRIWNPTTGDLVKELQGHLDWVNCLAFSMDGRLLASGSGDTYVNVWNPTEGVLVKQLKGHVRWVNSLAFSPDGRRLASGSFDLSVRLWDLFASNPMIHQLNGHESSVQCLAYSPDGRWLASGSEDGSVRLWDGATGDVKGIVRMVAGVRSLVFSHKGALALGCDNGGVYIYEEGLRWGTHTNVLTAEEAVIRGAKGLTELNRRLLEQRGGFVEAEERPKITRELYQKLSMPLDWQKINDFAQEIRDQNRSTEALLDILYASKENPKVSIAASNAISILNNAGIPLSGLGLSGVQIPGANLAWSNLDHCNLKGANLQNVVLSGARLDHVDLRSATLDGVEFGELPSLQLQEAANCIAFDPDGKKMTIASGAEISVYNLDIDQPQKSALLQQGGSDITSFVYNKARTLLATRNQDGAITIWDTSKSTIISKPEFHGFNAVCLAFNPDGKTLATGNNDGSIRCLDPSTGKEHSKLNGHGNDVHCLAYNHDGTFLATGSQDASVRIYDLRTKNAFNLTGHGDRVRCLAYSTDGTWLASGGGDSSIKLWDAISHEEIYTLNGHHDQIRCLAFNKDKTHLASGSADGTIIIWDTSTGKQLNQFEGHRKSVNCLIYSPNDQWIASSGDDCMVRILKTTTVSQSFQKEPREERTLCLAYSPDGQCLATGSDDQSIALWDPSNGRKTANLEGHRLWVSCLAFSPDGKMIASLDSHAAILTN